MDELLNYSCGVFILTRFLSLNHSIHGVTTVIALKHSGVGSTQESWRQLHPYFCLWEGIDPSDLNLCTRGGSVSGRGELLPKMVSLVLHTILI